MRTTADCLDALAKGHTLESLQGNRVWLDDMGVQQSDNMGASRKGRPYRFSNPSYWFIASKEEQPTTEWGKMLFWAMFTATAFTLYSWYTSNAQFEEHSNQLAEKIDTLERQNQNLSKVVNDAIPMLRKYQATEADIMALGANKEYAEETIKASEALNASPKLLGR